MRRRRWLVRLAWLFGVLVVLLILFSVLLFNPFEGDLDHLDAMVPMGFGERNVTFVVRAPSMNALRDRAFLNERIRPSPFWSGMEKDYKLDQYLYGQLEEIERKIQLSVGGMVDFSFAEDVFGREVLMAGDMQVDDITASRYLFLTRVTWKVKLFLELLDYEAARSRLQQPGQLAVRAERFWFELEVENPEWKRNPDEKLVFYVARARDVLAFSNDLELIEQAVILSESQGADSVRVRHAGYRGSLPFETEGREASAWFDLLELTDKHDLAGVLEPDAGAPRGLEDLFFELVPPRIQYDASFRFGLGDRDRMATEILIAREDSRPIPKHLDSFYRGAFFRSRDVLAELGRYAPTDRTIALAALAIDPADFLRILHLYQTEARQELVADELRKAGLTPEDLASDLGSYLEAPVGLVLTRLNELVEGLPLDDHETGGDVKPQAAFHLLTRFIDESRIPIFLEYFLDQAPGLGLRVSHRPKAVEGLEDVRYFPMQFDTPIPEMPFVKPAMAIRGDRLFFSTRGEELIRLLRAAGGSEAVLADDVVAKGVLDAVPEENGLFVLFHGEILRRYLLDQRWEVAYEASLQRVDDRGWMADLRSKVSRQLQAENPGAEFSREMSAELARRVDSAKGEAKREDFEAGLESWRVAVENLDPVRAILLTLRPGTEETEGRILVECR